MPLLQQIADSLKKTVLMGTLLSIFGVLYAEPVYLYENPNPCPVKIISNMCQVFSITKIHKTKLVNLNYTLEETLHTNTLCQNYLNEDT